MLDDRERPGRRPAERFLRRVQDARVPDVLVDVLDVDEPRAKLVGDPADRARELDVLELQLSQRSWPGWRLTPTSTASRAYASSRLAGVTGGNTSRRPCSII